MDPRQGFSHLYNVNWKKKGVPETLRALAKKVGSYQGSLDASTVSIVLKNLRNMGTRCRETREVLAVLILKLDECRRQEFNVRQIRTSLYGLKSMSSDVREVRDVLAVLVSRIKGCREELSAQEVGNALYGLQSMSSDVQEARDVPCIYVCMYVCTYIYVYMHTMSVSNMRALHFICLRSQR
jgi:hypothetical protein